MKQLICILLLGVAFSPPASSEQPVYILAANLQQVITSSTLEWMPMSVNGDLDEAVIGAYQVMEDEAQEENSAADNSPGEPVYVCRARQKGVWVSGQLRPNENKCVVSLHRIPYAADRYEILRNIEGGARLSWIYKDKYTLMSQGAVTGSDEPVRTFIARRKTISSNSRRTQGALTHLLGRFNPTDNLGKYFFVDENEKQFETEDGEVLVETEPINYELSNVKLDLYRKRVAQEPLVLGRVTLKNDDEYGEVVRVDTVISYNYTYSYYWGHGHGLLTGLPLTITYNNGSTLHGQWGTRESVEKIQVYPIEAFLAPGTAVNVTLKGYYGEWDIPYSAIITAVYMDGERIARTIKDSRREYSMRGVMPQFGPVYFLHNNSFVPTTTTTTTSTTTTTTTTTTTSTERITTPWKTTSTTGGGGGGDDAIPIAPPEIFDIPSANKEDPNGKHMLSDEGDALSLKNRDKPAVNKKDDNGAGSSTVCTITFLLIFASCTLQLMT